MAAENDRGGYPAGTNWDSVDEIWLNAGSIPPRFRHYDDGVCTWPGPDGKIPEGWDGTYPPKQVIAVRSSRSGRSRRR